MSARGPPAGEVTQCSCICSRSLLTARRRGEKSARSSVLFFKCFLESYAAKSQSLRLQCKSEGLRNGSAKHFGNKVWLRDDAMRMTRWGRRATPAKHAPCGRNCKEVAVVATWSP